VGARSAEEIGLSENPSQRRRLPRRRNEGRGFILILIEVLWDN